jgi:hypothetical protein
MTALEFPTPDPRSLDESIRPVAEAVSGQYAIKRMIGRGGMGVVMLARDLRLDRLVAIKTLPAELSKDASLRERFLRESRTAGAMSHPNIVPIHGADEVRGIDGRKVVLVFSDGEDTSSRASQRSVTERAREEEVMVYAIGLETEYFDGVRVVRTRPDRGMRRIAEETGGGYFELKKTADLAPTFTRVAQELHSQYVVGFAPTQLDGRVHKLDVRVRQPGMTARARRSYVADPERYSRP